MQSSAARLNVAAGAKVYAITPTLADRSTERVYADEFGSLSTDSDWVPKEMFKAALHERFPKRGREISAIVLPRAAKNLSATRRISWWTCAKSSAGADLNRPDSDENP
jgi:hypothetical protein